MKNKMENQINLDQLKTLILIKGEERKDGGSLPSFSLSQFCFQSTSLLSFLSSRLAYQHLKYIVKVQDHNKVKSKGLGSGVWFTEILY